MALDIDRALVHIREMLETRGDDVSYIEEHADAVARPRYFTEFIELNTDNTTVMFALTKDVLKAVAKEFKEAEDIQHDIIKKYNNTKNFIIVVSELPSSASSNLFVAKDKELSAIGGMLQLFQLRELMYNPSKHELVPKHEKLTEDEVKQFMDQYMLKSKAHIPIIHKADVMARWLGIRPGDIVRITRYNETSGEYFYYRCCM
jgi:DNA-directed RNA polymerase I, II, and III subunit RPABC1